jgi:hypothetical protein
VGTRQLHVCFARALGLDWPSRPDRPPRLRSPSRFCQSSTSGPSPYVLVDSNFIHRRYYFPPRSRVKRVFHVQRHQRAVLLSAKRAGICEFRHLQDLLDDVHRDKPCRKPNWLSDSPPRSSTSFCRRALMGHIGLNFRCSVPSAFGIRTSLTLLHRSGKVLSSRAPLMTAKITRGDTLVVVFIASAGIPSGPGAFLLASLPTAASSSSSVKASTGACDRRLHSGASLSGKSLLTAASTSSLLPSHSAECTAAGVVVALPRLGWYLLVDVLTCSSPGEASRFSFLPPSFAFFRPLALILILRARHLVRPVSLLIAGRAVRLIFGIPRLVPWFTASQAAVLPVYFALAIFPDVSEPLASETPPGSVRALDPTRVPPDVQFSDLKILFAVYNGSVANANSLRPLLGFAAIVTTMSSAPLSPSVACFISSSLTSSAVVLSWMSLMKIFFAVTFCAALLFPYFFLRHS